jgi:hypothetical protein
MTDARETPEPLTPCAAHRPAYHNGCDERARVTSDAALRQARETPEPLKPERIVKPFTDEHDRAEDHVASMLAAYLDPTDAERAANDVMARLHLSGYDFVKRGVRPLDCGDHYQVARCAATPDPADMTQVGPDGRVITAAEAGLTPDPAERIEGLRDRAQRQGTWGIEYGDDRFYGDVMAALRAAIPDPAEHVHEWRAGITNDFCLCGAKSILAFTPDPAEPGLREALQGAVDAWTAEYGPDDNAPWVTKALRALSDATEGQS